MLYMLAPSGQGVVYVPDADNLTDFMKKAKSTWRQHHPGSSKKRGRPSLEHVIIKECEEAAKEGLIKQQASLGKICRVVQERLKEKSSEDNPVPHEDTIHRYGRAWKKGNFMLLLKADMSSSDGMSLLATALELAWRHRFIPSQVYMRKLKQR